MYSMFAPFFVHALCFSLLSSVPDPSLLIGEWVQDQDHQQYIEIRELEGNMWLNAPQWSARPLMMAVEGGIWSVSADGLRVNIWANSTVIVLRYVDEETSWTQQFVRTTSFSSLLTSEASIGIPEMNRDFGAIKGLPIGEARSTASMFRAYLYRVDGTRQLIGSQPIDRDHGFEFTKLPDGEYQLFITSQAATAIQPSPALIQVILKNGEAVQKKFCFR